MKIEHIKPLHDFVLIEPLDQDTTLPSGIIIPDTAKEKPQRGLIVSVGPGRANDKGDIKKLVVKEGEKVMYKKWGGTEVKIENKSYLLMKEEDLIAVIRD